MPVNNRIHVEFDCCLDELNHFVFEPAVCNVAAVIRIHVHRNAKNINPKFILQFGDTRFIIEIAIPLNPVRADAGKLNFFIVLVDDTIAIDA